MSWPKYLIIFALFYFFAVLQNSFFAHFCILGVTPNLVLIFYFLLIFFERVDRFYLGIFGAFVAGFFLDIFSSHYLGISIILLLAIMFLIKKVLRTLWGRNNKYSIIYFISLFLIYLILYDTADFNINWLFLVEIAYNSAVALVGFYICDKFDIFENSDRQLKLL